MNTYPYYEWELPFALNAGLRRRAQRVLQWIWSLRTAVAMLVIAIPPRAYAQGAGGSDIGTIAEQFLNYIGGPAGGYIAAAALMVCSLLWGIGILSGRHAVEAVGAIVLAWGSAYLVRTTIGWA